MPAEASAVVDSSVFAAILLREPGHLELAERIGALLMVHAPPFFRFEVANALWKHREWPLEERQRALDTLFALPVDETFGRDDAQRALSLAVEHAHPFYDTAFIALAARRALPLLTLDQRQAELAKGVGVRVYDRFP
jgi:predicted nucleic acid-binding protein